MKANLDWKNAWYDLYTQYVKISECPNWFVEFARDGGFDDEWQYYTPKTKAPVIKRRPIWMGKQKKIPTEKAKDPFQKKLVEVVSKK